MARPAPRPRPRLAAAAGLLHDLTNYTQGESADHATASADLAARLLEEVELFSRSEIAGITGAIRRHSNKVPVDEPMDELLKDADVLAHWLYNVGLPPLSTHAARRERLERELAMGS